MIKNQKGTIVIISVIATMIMMAISAYFLNSLVVEMKVVESMDKAQEAYYLAESGINEAIWKLKNNEEWKSNFVDPDLNPDSEGEYWSATLEKEGVGNGDYQVVVQNTGLGEAEIYSTAEVPFLGKKAKRETQVTVFQALESPTEEAVIFSGGNGSNVQISHANLTINGGNIFSNHNLLVKGESVISLFDNQETENLEGQIWSSQNFNMGSEVELENYTAICSKNECSEECEVCPPEEKAIPTVDFDSEHQNSFKSRAKEMEDNNSCEVFCDTGEGAYQCSDQCVFSENQFEDLLWEVKEGGSLNIKSEITYVEGAVDLKGKRELLLEGVLVADGSIDIGMNLDWKRKGDEDSGISHIEVTNPEKDRPSGLLSKRKINFGNYSLKESSIIEGIIYSGDKVRMIGIPQKLTINGGIIGRQLFFITLWEGMEINFDNELILNGLGYVIDDKPVKPIFSPLIEIDHWEEVY